MHVPYAKIAIKEYILDKSKKLSNLTRRFQLINPSLSFGFCKRFVLSNPIEIEWPQLLKNDDMLSIILVSDQYQAVYTD
jgi:hypothetical protein